MAVTISSVHTVTCDTQEEYDSVIAELDGRQGIEVVPDPESLSLVVVVQTSGG